MEFKSLQQLNLMFTYGELTSMPSEVSINGITFHPSQSSNYYMTEMINGKAGFMVYALDPKPENIERFKELHRSAEEGLQNRIVFAWKFKDLEMYPASVKNVSRTRVMGESEEDDSVKISKDKIIGDQIKVTLLGFNKHEPIVAKVDTGAEISSLHADNLRVSKDTNEPTAKFVFGGREYSMPIEDHHAVKTADNGTEYRPVVKFDVRVDGGQGALQDILFNLNDRSNMPNKILLGKNFLDKGKFIIDPSQKNESEEVDWDILQEMFTDEYPILNSARRFQFDFIKEFVERGTTFLPASVEEDKDEDDVEESV